MEQLQETNSLVNDTTILLSLLAEFHFILQETFPSSKGLILCNISSTRGDRWISVIRKMPATHTFNSIKREFFVMPNNTLGLYSLHKYDSPEHLSAFLEQDNFQSILLCNDYIPEDLISVADTLSISLSEPPQERILEEIELCKDYFRKYPNDLDIAIQQASSSKIFQDRKTSASVLVERLFITAEIYLFWYRNCFSEDKTQKRKQILYSNLKNLELNHINCDEMIDLADAFIQIFNDFVTNHPDIISCPVDQIDGAAFSGLESERTILFDSNYYYISESLFKVICQPLLETTGLKTICRNLVREGIIQTDGNRQGNYSRKKTIYTVYGFNPRSRFYFLNKEPLQSCGYISLDERSIQK